MAQRCLITLQQPHCLLKRSDLSETFYPCRVRDRLRGAEHLRAAQPGEQPCLAESEPGCPRPVFGRYGQESDADLAAPSLAVGRYLQGNDLVRGSSVPALPAEPGAAAEYAVVEGLGRDRRRRRLVQIAPVAGELMIYLSTSLLLLLFVFYCERYS